MPAIVALVVIGFESHDEYVETGRVSVTITDESLTWKLGIAEDFLLDHFLHRSEDDDRWIRIESLQRIAL